MFGGSAGASESDMRAKLRDAVARDGGQARWAHQHEIAPTVVCDVLAGRREVSEAIANALGYVRRVTYQQVNR